MNHKLSRRALLAAAGGSVAAATLPGCGSPDPERYTQADIDGLATQRQQEQASRGRGIYGPQVYEGYRGLARLPWFDLDEQGALRCVDDSFAPAIDVHSHLGISVLFRPALDLLASSPRVRHLLDCDATDPGSSFDLDVYANGNFSEEALSELQWNTIAQGLWGSPYARTQTVPNLLREMDAMRVGHAVLLPIKLGLPFGDRLTEDWRAAVNTAGVQARLHAGLSVYPGAPDALPQMREHAAAGGRVIKLHPTVQRFYPDEEGYMPLYEEAQRLGLVVFFHGGRAGIEPASSHPYAMPRHYEAPLREFPQLQFILGHAGARDNGAMLELALRYDNAWLGIHGQSISSLDTMIERTGGERLLFGSDWPFYHIGSSLAKVLVATEAPGRRALRDRILSRNARQLLPGVWDDTAS